MSWSRPSKINKVVMTMVYSDFLMVWGAGFLSPIFAVYIVKDIEGGSLAVVGFATMIYWVVKSIVQIPVSLYADKHRGEFDDYNMMIGGSLAIAAVPLMYFWFATDVWHIYLIQAINGIASGFYVPTWLGTFTRHIDKHKESTEWTIHSNLVGIGFAVSAAIGGVLADKFGFRVIFLLVSAALFLGTFVLIMVRGGLDGDPDGDGIHKKVKLHKQRQELQS